MGQGMEMTVNRLPARTWNWLGMNESHLSDIVIEGKYPVSPEIEGTGYTWVAGETWGNAGDSSGSGWESVSWEEIETGMGKDMELLGGEKPDILMSGGSGREKCPAAGTKAATGEDSLAVLDFNYGKEGNYYNRLNLFAEKGTVLNAALVLRSSAAKGLSGIRTRIYAEEGAKVRLYVAQILGEGFTCINDLGGICEKAASVEIIKLELGAGKLYAGGHMELVGERSSFAARIGYTGRKDQRLDMNYTARHRGRQSESLMDISGVLEDRAFKLFRGTIDFVQGCSGSVGEEKEDVLLLGGDMVNQTIPLILCGEEEVEGGHGATIGRLDENMLFYLGTRGIPGEEAGRLMARARMDALCSLLPSREVRKQVRDYMEGGKADGKF